MKQTCQRLDLLTSQVFYIHVYIVATNFIQMCKLRTKFQFVTKDIYHYQIDLNTECHSLLFLNSQEYFSSFSYYKFFLTLSLSHTNTFLSIALIIRFCVFPGINKKKQFLQTAVHPVHGQYNSKTKQMPIGNSVR